MVMLDKTLVRKTVPLLLFLGDSYFTNFECFAGSEKHWDVDNFIDLHPHKTMVAMRDDAVPFEGFALLEGGAASVAHAKVLAKGGLTWYGCLDDLMLIGRWASEVPRVTIVNIGACDLANTNFGSVKSEESLGQRYGKMFWSGSQNS